MFGEAAWMLTQLLHNRWGQRHESPSFLGFWRQSDTVLKLPRDVHAAPLEVDVMKADPEQLRLAQAADRTNFDQQEGVRIRMPDERREFLGRKGAHVSFVGWRVHEFALVADDPAEATGVLEKRAEQLEGCQDRAGTNALAERFFPVDDLGLLNRSQAPRSEPRLTAGGSPSAGGMK